MTSCQNSSDCSCNYNTKFRSPISGVRSFNDLDAARECANTCQKPIFIAFLSLASSNHRMERKVLNQEEIARKLDSEFVVTTLYVDDRTKLTEPLAIGEKTVETKGEWNIAFQIEECQNVTQPQFLILNPSSDETISTFNQLTAEEVDSTLTEALQRFNAAKN